jgi:hypothetical protein
MPVFVIQKTFLQFFTAGGKIEMGGKTVGMYVVYLSDPYVCDTAPADVFSPVYHEL